MCSKSLHGVGIFSHIFQIFWSIVTDSITRFINTVFWCNNWHLNHVYPSINIYCLFLYITVFLQVFSCSDQFNFEMLIYEANLLYMGNWRVAFWFNCHLWNYVYQLSLNTDWIYKHFRFAFWSNLHLNPSININLNCFPCVFCCNTRFHF